MKFRFCRGIPDISGAHTVRFVDQYKNRISVPLLLSNALLFFQGNIQQQQHGGIL